MTARFNFFGAVYTDVVNLFPGAQLTDFDDGNGSGQTRIEAALGRISRDVASAFTPEVYKQLTTVDCEEAIKYATAGQTTATLSLTPVKSATLHLWQYPNAALYDPSRWAMYGGSQGLYGLRDWIYRKPTLGVYEIDQVQYSIAVNLTTGAITNLPPLNLGDRLFASYDVDVASASFALQSVADIVNYGAAAELGDRLFSEASAAWKLVTDYAKRYADALEKITKGGWIPDEVHSVPHWTPVDRVSEEVGSVRLYRG